ncbi:MAG: IS21-like element helper ATPase IstB [Sphingomonadaceae bacterium]
MPRQHQPTGPDELIERLTRHLDCLGLKLTRDKIEEYLAWATREKPAAGQLLEHIFGQEAAFKLERRIDRRISVSGLREHKTLEAFDWAFQPGIDKAFVMELGGMQFVRRKEDLVITGKSGTGKSHILQALGLRACQQQLSVRYARCVDLLDDLYAGLADSTYRIRLKRWASPDLLIIDDVGLGQVKKREDEPTAAHTLFNLIDKRHGHASTAFSSNIKLSAWGRYLGDATLAVAILDRVAMHSVRLDIDGPSYRQHLARDRAKKSGTVLPDDADMNAASIDAQPTV